jgi:integrase
MIQQGQKYRLRWYSGNRRCSKTVYANLTEAKKYLSEQVRKKDTFLDRGTILLTNYAQCWLQMKKIRLKESSFDDVEQIIRNHVAPFFKDVKLNEVYASNIDNFISHLSKKKSTKGVCLSGHTINKVLFVLNGIFKYAVRDCRIEHNPISLEYHKVKENLKQADYFTLREMNLFLKNIHPEYKTFFTLLWHSGMRIGEAVALKWQDIDWNKGWITITRQIYQKSGKDIVTEPKTKSGLRKVFLTPFILQELKSYNERVKTYHINGYVFERDGRSYRKTGIVRSQFKLAIRKAGLRDSLTPHSIRHSTISLLRQYFPDFIIKSFAGHSLNKSDVTNLYSHLSDDDMRDYARQLGEILAQDNDGMVRKLYEVKR